MGSQLSVPRLYPCVSRCGERSRVSTSSSPSIMLPLGEHPCLYDRKSGILFKMPRVVVDQKGKFESDELFRRLSRESEVRYTGYRERPMEERRSKFKNACREGCTEVAFVNTGTNLQLVFHPCSNGYSDSCDFDAEKGKVHLKSSFIMNGVCVRWRGWLDLERLDGVGCLEYDEQLAQVEDKILREQIEKYNQGLKDFEEKHRAFLPPRVRRSHSEDPESMQMSPRSNGSVSN